MTYDQPFLLYGATGYTGQLTAAMAVDLGMRPILAGRNREKVERVYNWEKIAAEHVRVFESVIAGR